MLTGAIAGLGSQYVIGLKAVNCQNGDVLAEAQEQAAGKEGVLKALDAAAVSLRSKLGESLSTVQEYATPLAPNIPQNGGHPATLYWASQRICKPAMRF